jgi:hypothetical protein
VNAEIVGVCKTILFILLTVGSFVTFSNGLSAFVLGMYLPKSKHQEDLLIEGTRDMMVSLVFFALACIGLGVWLV